MIFVCKRPAKAWESKPIFTQIEEEMDSNGSDVGNTK
jgi:hypothetical protein